MVAAATSSSADEIRPSIHVIETAAEAIRDAGLERGRLALVGASYMTAAAYLGLVEQLPDAELVRADTLIETAAADQEPGGAAADPARLRARQPRRSRR